MFVMGDSPRDVHGFSPTQLRAVDAERFVRLQALNREIDRLRTQLAATERERDNLSLKLRGRG